MATDEPFPEAMMPCIERFFQSEHQREPGETVYDDVFDSALFFPLQRRRELGAMITLARARVPRTVMEIGTDKGGGLYHWCKCLTHVKKVIACEVRGTPYKGQFERAFPNIQFLWLECSSHSTAAARAVQRWLDRDRIDVLFLDGDKGRFTDDFDRYQPFLARQSLVLMHDIQDAAPRRSYDEVCMRGYTHGEIVDVTESNESMWRESLGIPASCPHESWLRYWKGDSAGVGCIFLDGDEGGDEE